jgi:hypothetical protein
MCCFEDEVEFIVVEHLADFSSVAGEGAIFVGPDSYADFVTLTEEGINEKAD